MKIYGLSMSTCTRKVLTVLAEKNATFDLVNVDIMKGDGKGAEHLARQPFGQIPAMDDNGFHLYESRAIARYLDETLPGTSLSPKSAKGHAEMEQWISIEMQNFTPHAMTILYQLMFAPMRGAQPDMAKVEEAKPKLEKCCDVMEAHLATGGPFLLGDTFTLADISYMPYVEYLMKTPLASVITSRPKLAAWWKACSERPSWKKVTN